MPNEASITVAVRIRPLSSEAGVLQTPRKKTTKKSTNLTDSNRWNRIRSSRNVSRYRRRRPFAHRRILEAVDDRMLIFDPNSTRSLSEMESNSFLQRMNRRANSGGGSRVGCHNRRNREHRFIFDRLFDEDSEQNEVYECIGQPLLNSALEGYNATIFAYGATGCGKTYTITGNSQHPGVLFLAMRDLFGRIDHMKDVKDITLTLTYLEIYNETIRDLLNPHTDPRMLQLLENGHREIVVSNLSEHHPQTVNEVMQLIVEGNKYRSVSPTEANAVSSRSHAVLQMKIVQRPKNQVDLEEKRTTSTLSFIDLAGSERASATQNRGIRLHEGANINKSLLALGNCIKALSDKKSYFYIPYRDSKLTRLLKFSLGGNCKTVMIVCVSPSSIHYDETLNALKYADRAKSIKTKAVRNCQSVSKHVASYLKIINQQKKQIAFLNAQKDRMIQQSIAEGEDKRKICDSKMQETLDRMQRALDKNSNIKTRKAMILAKKQLALVQLNYLTSSMDIVNENGGGSLKYDEQFQSLVQCIQDQINRLENLISGLTSEYEKPTEFDFVLKESSRAVLSKLQRSEGWCSKDDELFKSRVNGMYLTMERSIFMEAMDIFEEFSKESQGMSVILGEFFNILEHIFSIRNQVGESSEEVKEKLAVNYNQMIDSCKLMIQNAMDVNNPSMNTATDRNIGSHYSFKSPKRSKSGASNVTPTKRSSTTSLLSPFTKKLDGKKDADRSVDMGGVTKVSQKENNNAIPVSPTNRLTLRALTATPKIGSPGRLAGLGITPYSSSGSPKKGKFLLPYLMSETDGDVSGSMDVDEV